MTTIKSDEERLSDIEDKLDKLTEDVSDLVVAWKAASWLVSAVKWVGGAAVGLIAIFTFIKGFK